jgi:hypothetical protein
VNPELSVVPYFADAVYGGAEQRVKSVVFPQAMAFQESVDTGLSFPMFMQRGGCRTVIA